MKNGVFSRINRYSQQRSKRHLKNAFLEIVKENIHKLLKGDNVMCEIPDKIPDCESRSY